MRKLSKSFVLQMPALTSLAVLFFFAASDGHVKTIAPANAVGHPKLIKTQGSDAYQNVHCGLQDKSGNLWFGTTGEGVYRYDGKLFTQFTKSDGLSSNTIWAILEDKAGTIWFGTDAGICRYDGKTIASVPVTLTGSTTLYTDNSSDSSAPSQNRIWSIMQDKGGTIWFGTDDGLYCFDGATFHCFLDDASIINRNGLTLKNVQCMLEDNAGILWFGSGPMASEGICRYDGRSIENFKPRNEGWIRNIIQDKTDNILFATRHNGVCKFDGRDFTFISDSPNMVKTSMMMCLEDKAGNTWFASDYGAELNDTVGGVWRYDGKSFRKFSTKDGLTNNAVSLILEDRSGNIWIGTRNIGLYRYDGKKITSLSE